MALKKRYSKKRGPVTAKKVEYDGIKFASGLERYMYKALKEAGIEANYEGASYTVLEGFQFNNDSYEKQSNGKGDFKNRGRKKILGIKYTPDFVSEDFIIECKGRANESFPLRWKLFKAFAAKNLEGVSIYKPQNQKDCDDVISFIMYNRSKLF